jgi:LPXTG-motif cell wall-anchored protein
MRLTRQRLAATVLIGGLTTLGIGLSAGPASANVSDCNGYIGLPQSGSLHITSTPAAGSSVAPGSSISLNASWNDANFNETDRMFLCATVDGTFNSAMSSEDKGVGNTGTWTGAATVPANAPAGSNICVVAALLGQLPTQPVSQGQMVSEKLCYTAAEATTTTTVAPTTTTTTTAPAVTQPSDVGTSDAGGPSAPAEPAPTAVAPEVVQAPAPAAELPRTGSSSADLAGFGAVVLALGGLARFFGRKRPSEA